MESASHFEYNKTFTLQQLPHYVAQTLAATIASLDHGRSYGSGAIGNKH